MFRAFGRRSAKIASCLAVSACAPRVPPAATGGGASSTAVVWDYAVTADRAFGLGVEATFQGPVSSDLVIDEAVAPFLSDVAVVEGGASRSVGHDGGRIGVPCAAGCRVRYRLRLEEAAEASADVDVALAAGGAVFAPPCTWLLHPDGGGERGRYRFRVTTEAPLRFVTGVRPAGSTRDSYEADVRTFEEASFSAFGPLRTPSTRDDSISLAAAPGTPLSDAAIARWLSAETTALAGYLGGFPEDRAVVFVAPGTSEVLRGVTRGGGGASVLLRLPPLTTAIDLASEWVLLHELLHVAFPQIQGGHTWFSEGYASYVEPLARARAGLVSAERVWLDLLQGLPQGLPGPDDRGLDADDSWGRTYWGGALYFLLADIEIRQRTGGARSLEDAARAVARAGANVEAAWPLDRVLSTLDGATSVPVLRELYERLGRAPGTVDLDAFLGRLGVRRVGAGVEFDDAAPLSAIRRALTTVSKSAPDAGKLPASREGK